MTELERAIAERDAWEDTAAQHYRNETYYRGLVVACGEAIGRDAYVARDGSVSDDVLCAKVPELVAKLVGKPETITKS